MYTVAEAADLLGIGRSTAYELVARGELPTVKIGGRVVVTRPALTELVGVEPPLPYELDLVPYEETDRPATLRLRPRRRMDGDTGQAALPFGA